jgi:protein-tyrosine phosphatase
MFRAVRLPSGIGGHLFLHSVPGQFPEPLESVLNEIRRSGVTRIVCLAPADEISRRSPSYALAIQNKQIPCERDVCEVADLAVPTDWCAFAALVRKTAYRLREGESILLHCGEGIGRTGMFATCVLLMLGTTLEQARAIVAKAGSEAEIPEQNELISWFAAKCKP